MMGDGNALNVEVQIRARVFAMTVVGRMIQMITRMGRASVQNVKDSVMILEKCGITCMIQIGCSPIDSEWCFC